MPLWIRRASCWLTARSTRLLRMLVALAIGGAATLWTLSPWSDNSMIGQGLFWIAISAILLLIAEAPVRMWRRSRAKQSLVSERALLRGSYIDRVVDIGRTVMGDGHANADTLRGRLVRCPRGVQILVRRSARGRVSDDVVGYLACWTVTADATERFLSGEYGSALDLQDEDFTVDRPAAVYITMLYGADSVARRTMIQVANEQLRGLFELPDGPSVLLARPATHDGEMLMRKAGMAPLPGADAGVWSVDRVRLLETMQHPTLTEVRP